MHKQTERNGCAAHWWC